MKRFVLTAALVSLVFCTSGCVKTSYNIEIDKKNNITVSETDAYNQELFKALAKENNSVKDLSTIDDDIEKDKESLISEGYDVQDYEQDGFKGLVIKKVFPKNSLKDKDLPAGFTSDKINPFVVEKGFLKTHYQLNLVYDVSKIAENNNNRAVLSGLSKLDNTADTNKQQDSNYDTDENNAAEETVSDGTDNDDFAAQDSDKSSDVQNKNIDNVIGAVVDSVPGLAPSMDLTIKVPYKATKSNAAKVLSDTEYFWQIDSKKPNEIYIDYEKYNYGNIILSIILTIIFVFFGIYYKKFLNTSNW